MTEKMKGIPAKAESTDKSPVVSGAVEKIPTGILGFDDVLEGGLPEGRALLITGATGTGKTVFAAEFLYRGIMKYKQNGVFVTFEEHASDIIKNVRGFGWDFDMLIKQEKLAFVDASPDITPTQESGKYDLTGLVERIKYAIGKVKAKRVTIDALSMLFSKFKNKDTVRRAIYRMCDELKRLGVTSVITAERTGGDRYAITRYGVEEYVVDGVVELSLEPGQQKFLRKMFIKKLRGVGYRSGLVEFDITQEGLEVYPKIAVDRRVSKTDFKIREAFGIKGVDETMGGGVPQGHMLLVSGNTGTGKTLFSMQFLAEGMKNGQNAVFVALEEPVEQVKKTAQNLGFDFEKYEKEGKLLFICPSLVDISNDKLLYEIVAATNKVGAERVVIDSVSSLRSATMPNESVRQFLYQAASFFKRSGVTCVMNYLSDTNFGAIKGQLLASLDTNVMRISSIVDGILILLYVERDQMVKRIFNVLKMRGSWHSGDIFKYTIERKGIQFGERYIE